MKGARALIDVFEETKTRLTMQDVAQHYGFTPNRAGFIKCPFHTGDRMASLKVYPGGRGFHCFACNRGGSVVDFVAQLYGVDALGAVRRLNDDFHLGLPIDRQQTPQERTEVAKAAAKRRELSKIAKAFEAWRGAMLDKLTACFQEGHLALQSLEAPADFNRLTDAQTLAIREQAHIEWLADALISGTMAEQMEIFRERGQIGQLCEKILNSTQTKSGAA